MAGKIYSSQDPGLTKFQQDSRLAVEKIVNTPLDHFFTSPADMGVESLAEAFAMSDPDYQLKQEKKMRSGRTEQYEDTPDHEFQNLVRNYEKLGSVEAMAEMQKQKKIDWAQRTVDFFNEHPDGKDDSWMSKNFGNIMKAVFVAGTAGAGAAALGAGAAAGAGAGTAAGAGAGAAAGTAAGVGAGAAAAGAGAAGTAAVGSGVAGALGLSGLPASMLNAGLINAGVKAGTNLATGQSIFDGVLKSGLTGAVGAGLAPAASGFVGTGLKNLGISPEMATSLIKPITTGVVGAGLGLANGQNLGSAVLGGLQGGLASYGGDMISEYTNSLGLDKPIKGVLDSAGKGALSAGIRGGNVLQGALQGGVSGGIKQGTNWLTDLFKQPSTGGKMDLTSLFGSADFGYGGDSDKDWLKGLETDLSNPTGAPYNPSFIDYFGKPDDKFTIGDAEAPDMSYFESLFGNSGTSGGVSDSVIKALGGAAGNASGSFVGNLMKQLGGVGTAAGQNPLASIAAALGAYGSIKNAGKPQGDLSLVDKLMEKGATQANTPVQPRGQVVARDPRLFTQNYDLDGRPVKVGIETELANMYRDELGRAPDQAGMEWWKQAMEKGANRDQVMQGLDASSEGTVYDAYRSELGRNPDTDGGKWWQTQIDSGTLKPQDLNAELRKSQEYQQGRNGPLTTMFQGGK